VPFGVYKLIYGLDTIGTVKLPLEGGYPKLPSALRLGPYGHSKPPAKPLFPVPFGPSFPVPLAGLGEGGRSG
jgi:hypothetical protein